MLWTKSVLTFGIQVINGPTTPSGAWLSREAGPWNAKVNIRRLSLMRWSIPLRADFLSFPPEVCVALRAGNRYKSFIIMTKGKTMNFRTRIVAGVSAGAMVSLFGVASTPAIAGSLPASALGSGSLTVYTEVFPVTITRTGGFAGFQDVLVVAGDGLVSVTQKGQPQRHCRVTPETADRVRTAASQVPWSRITPDGGQARFPDDMVSMVRSPAGGPVRLEDARVGAGGQVFQDLLTDLSVGPAAPRLCKSA